MNTHRNLSIAFAALATASAGCVPGEISGRAAPPFGTETQTLTDDVVGVTLTIPDHWVIERDPVLFDTHGFIVFEPPAGGEVAAEGHSDGAVARVALAHRATAAALDDLVQIKLQQYAELDPDVTEVTLAGGQTGVAITGLPGTQPYSIVYAADGDRVYEVGLWSGEPGIDERGERLLASLSFHPPARPVEALSLPAPEQALYGLPEGDLAVASRQAAEARKLLFEQAAAEDVTLRLAATQETEEPPEPIGGDGASGATCGFTAPASLYWQLQWDATNTFYSGSWYNLRRRPGWSAMSGNYGSWWGTNFHIWRCHTGVLNQWYANDWPAQYWANAYAAFSGHVEWAGWGTDGFASLGRYVVVRNGRYRSLTAHLTRIAPGITWGTWINGYWTVIGYAGDTGEAYANADWAPHLHARVGWGESLTYNGQPYGGHSVRPRSLRCFACTDYDVAASGAGGFYTRFRHGRWMKY